MRNEKTTDVLADDIGLDVHALTDGEGAERGVPEGVVYQRYLNGGGRGKLVHREAHPVDRERPVWNHQLAKLGVDGEVDHRGVGASLDLNDPRNAIDVTEHEVSAKAAVGTHGALEIHPPAFSPLGNCGASKRRFNRRDLEPLRSARNDGEARAVHGNTLTLGQVIVRAPDAQRTPSGRERHALDDADVIDESCEHVTFLRERTRS